MVVLRCAISRSCYVCIMPQHTTKWGEIFSEETIIFMHLQFLGHISSFSIPKSQSRIFEIMTLKCSRLISSSDNKKILLTTRNVRLDTGRYATKYYCCHFITFSDALFKGQFFSVLFFFMSPLYSLL